MDTDVIIYLIFVAFAILSRFLKKKKDPEEQESRPGADFEDNQPRRPQKQVSFEDLLRELTGEAQPQPQQRQAPVEKPRQHRSYEDETYEVENYEEQYARDEEAKEIYRKSVRQAKNLKTIDELVDYNTVKTKLTEEYDPYHQKRKDTVADDIRKQLQDPDQVKRAVILSEILNRKY